MHRRPGLPFGGPFGGMMPGMAGTPVNMTPVTPPRVLLAFQYAELMQQPVMAALAGRASVLDSVPAPQVAAPAMTESQTKTLKTGLELLERYFGGEFDDIDPNSYAEEANEPENFFERMVDLVDPGVLPPDRLARLLAVMGINTPEQFSSILIALESSMDQPQPPSP